MQNKVLIEGIITNQPSLSKFDSVMVFIKQTFKKNDGKESSTRFRCEAKGAIAQEIASNYLQNQFVQLTGILRDTKAKKKNDEGTWVELMDQFGDQVWEKCIYITAIQKLGSYSAEATKDREAAMSFAPKKTPAHIPPPLPKQPTPVFKKNINPAPHYQQPMEEENPFEELPF